MISISSVREFEILITTNDHRTLQLSEFRTLDVQGYVRRDVRWHFNIINLSFSYFSLHHLRLIAI
jgi:hypothetical protein